MRKKILFLMFILFSMTSYATVTNMTCAEAAAAALSLSSNNVPGTDSVCVIGYVTNTNGTISRGQQTFWMDDVQGNRLTLQSYYGNLPSELLSTSTPLCVGDKISLKGYLLRYNTTPEIKNGTITLLERSTSQVDTFHVSISEAIAIGQTLVNNTSTSNVYVIDSVSVISFITNNATNNTANYYVGNNSDTIQAYNVSLEDYLIPEVGDNVSLTGRLKNYYGKIEIEGSSINNSRFVMDNLIYEKYTSFVKIQKVFNDQIPLGRVVIPDTISHGGSNFYVRTINTDAFRLNTSLTEVVIPHSVVDIGPNAFLGCTGLRIVRMSPNSSLMSEINSFKGCYNVEAVHIDNLKNWCTFYRQDFLSNPTHCGSHIYLNGEELTNIIFPNSISWINGGAFAGCKYIEFVSLPQSMYSIYSDAFYGCYSLKKVLNQSSLDVVKGAISNGYVACYADTVYTGCLIDDYLFNADSTGLITYVGNDSIITLPQLTNYVIADSAFFNNKRLKSVVCSNSVITIGRSAFDNCSNLESVELSSSIGSIGHTAFSGCSSLKSIVIPNSIQSIGESAFYNCSSLRNVSLSNSLRTISPACFEGCSNLLNFVFPSSLTSIGDSAFKNCSNLKSAEIPDGVSQIGVSAFEECTSLKKVSIPESITEIYNAFYHCPIDTVVWNAINYSDYPFDNSTKSLMRSFTFGRNVQYIPSNLCQGMSNNLALTELDLPNVISIGANAFDGGAPRLQKLDLGASVTQLGANSFAQCGQLTRVTCRALQVPLVQQSSFYNYLGYLYVPCESLEDYQMDMTFSRFRNIRCIDETQTSLSDENFEHNATKCIIDGHLFILRDGQMYTPTGTMVE